MTQRRLALAALVFTVAISVGALVFGALAHSGDWLVYATPPIAVLYVGTGSLLVTRRSGSRVGWVLIGIGFLQAVNVLNSTYADYVFGRSARPGELAQLSAWASTWTWFPSIGLLVTFLPLLFPDGRPPSPRWRWVGWLAAVGISVGLAGLISFSWHLRLGGFDDPNSNAPSGTGGTIAFAGILLAGVAAVAAIVSLIVRRRRARGDERQQLRWFLYVAGYLIPAVAVAGTPVDRNTVALAIGFVLLPITIAVAVLKYRLYDIDVVIKKTLIAGVLVVLLGAIAVFFFLTVGQVALWRGTSRGFSVAIGVGGRPPLHAGAPRFPEDRRSDRLRTPRELV